MASEVRPRPFQKANLSYQKTPTNIQPTKKRCKIHQMNANVRDFEAELPAQHERVEKREETRLSPEAEVQTMTAL